MIRLLGPFFVCDVSDGGDSGPIFKVQRCPCTTQSIPDGSTVLSRPKIGSFDGKDKVGKGDSFIFGMVDDENTSIQMMLTEYSPPHLDDDILSCSWKRANEDLDFQNVNYLTTEFDCFAQRSGEIISDNLGRGDSIGEFSVEGKSSSSVWEMVSQTLLRACRETYKQTGGLQFCCKHDVDGRNVTAKDTSDSLSKFCYLAGPINIPHLIHSANEFDTSCEMLVKWLRQDRFGLNVEFVQELIEQLPGANACSGYKFLTKRSDNSTSQTVGSGFLLAKRKSDVQGEKESNGFIKSCKRPRTHVVGDSERKDYFPIGKPLSSKLPTYLIGDFLQAWEFSCRFSEVLGLEEPISYQELEYELINPWLDGQNPLGKPANEFQDIGDVNPCKRNGINDHALVPSNTSASTIPSENPCAPITMETESMRDVAQAKLASFTHSRCTGAILTKAHSSLLRVLVGELLLKVAAYVYPNFDAGESKSRRGRKKDVDNSVTANKTKLDMLPVNALTWPELARRYILAVLSMEANLDSVEIICRESGKVFHCLQGDGGTLCGSLTGVAAIEADALLLAEATKRIFGSVQCRNDVCSIDQKESGAVSASKMMNVNVSEVPEWAQVLEPVRKLPTNVGARIRKCVYEALERNPPEWAKKALEHSISKEVYKGNASGPTKRAVISVLADVSRENLQPKPEKKEKGRNVGTISDVIMKQCRIVLRHAAAADEERVFCNLLGRSFLNPNDNDDEGLLGYPAMVSRPLDFRTIDLRLAAGAYCGLHGAFLEDVREVWKNIRTAYGDRSDLIDLAETLSQKFEVLYEKEVLTLVNKIVESANPDCLSEEAKKERDDMLAHASESSLPKAPWEEGVCKVCGMDKDDDNVLLCDTCDSEYHTYCLDPPLVRIPEGNWYCPSCVSGQFMSRAASCGSRVMSSLGKRIRQRELTHNALEALAQLANTMELKEYWEFSVEERIFLIKFLCDEALNSAIIRSHLDQCACVSADLQQKLRSLTAEWKNLKFREEILAMNLVKGKINVLNGGGELKSDSLAALLSNDGKLMGQLPNRSSYISSVSANSVQLEDGNGPNNSSKQQCWDFSKGVSDKPCASSGNQNSKASDIVSENLFSQRHSGSRVACRKNELPMSIRRQKNDSSGENASSNFNSHQESNHGSCGSMLSTTEVMPDHNLSDTIATNMAENIPSKRASVSQADNPESNSLKNEISCLQDSIATLESELLKVSVRKELLGRDSAGRLYWVFGGSGTCHRVLVNGSLTEGQSKVKENPLGSSGLNISELYPSEQKIGISICSSWAHHQSDAEIEELIGWLRNNDVRERDLRESIIQWQQSKSKDSNDAKTRRQNEIQSSSLNSSDGGKALDSNFLVTKAVTALEKKFGPFLEPEANGIPKKQGHKAKITREGRMYRCECLEPLWPSRHHCLSCHQTFSTSEDLEGHGNGICSRGSPVLESSQMNEDSSKRERMMTETSLEKCSDDVRTVGASKSEKHGNGSCFTKYQNDPECPFDFEEIRSKFVTQSSLKEVIKDIGLIGSSGTPSFVPTVSPYLSDPALSLIPTMENDVNPCDGSSDLENQQQLSKKRASVASGMNIVNKSNKRGAENDVDEEASKVERSKSKCTSGKDQVSSIKNKSQLLGVGKGRVIPKSSLRPLVGRVSEILRRLKVNLLDMDAALPEEALRPSRIDSEKRCAWRAFVKSSVSIYEMSQATIVLEDIIKTEYLRNDWWYWSSPSAAAKISTLSALALRIYTLDSAVIYEKPLSSDATEISKPGCKSDKESPLNSNPTKKLKSSSPPVRKALDSHPADNSKPKTRQSKRRKDTGG